MFVSLSNTSGKSFFCLKERGIVVDLPFVCSCTSSTTNKTTESTKVGHVYRLTITCATIKML